MSNIQDRINLLRGSMASEHINVCIIPTSDYHGSEYVGDFFRVREFFSGFTGSAGTLVVTASETLLWTDGRYFLQAADQLNGTGITLMKQGEEGVPTLTDHIADILRPGDVLAFDGRVFSVSLGRKLAKMASDKGASVRFDIDPASGIWENRPAISAEPIYIHDTAFCGRTASDKLADVRKEMDKMGCDIHILTALDHIAWLINLRGSDVACNPVFLSYLYLTADDGILFVNREAVSSEVRDHLEDLNISIREYDSVYGFVAGLTGDHTIMIDEDTLNYSISALIPGTCRVVSCDAPTSMLKAVKNETEMANLRAVNITDGVAMVKTLFWLDSNIGKTPLTELSVCDKLKEFRSAGRGYKDISFDTIAGYNAHGAIIHYEPTPDTNAALAPEGLLLIDSGAQYEGGTTDITRTVALGPLTDEMRHHYTMVLRANLDVASAVFRDGCTGANLDILARLPFWKERCDYNHGTGHGVGFFLNVHEGPHSLNWFNRKGCHIPFREGMVVTDEPGIYIEGRYGIRIENDILCVSDCQNSYGRFMRWEILTLCPIDLRPVIISELSDSEIGFLNEYHSRVRTLLTPHLSQEESEWLRAATEPVSRS